MPGCVPIKLYLQTRVVSHPAGHSELAPDLEHHPPPGPGKRFSHQGALLSWRRCVPSPPGPVGSGAQWRGASAVRHRRVGRADPGDAGMDQRCPAHQPALPPTRFPQSFTQLREETGPLWGQEDLQKESQVRPPSGDTENGTHWRLYSTHSKNQTGSKRTQGTDVDGPGLMG